MFTSALSAIPAEAGIQRMVGLDTRLRGNDMGIGFIKTLKGPIFVAIIYTIESCRFPGEEAHRPHGQGFHR
jgi:hypothetical protein